MFSLRLRWALIICVLLAGAATRLYRLSELPPGLYVDEGFYGWDARQVLLGHPEIYFDANNGREPLYIYLVAGLITLVGNTVLALRLTSALVGIATLAAAFAVGRALFNWRVGLITMTLTAFTFWNLALNRLGLRVNTMPLLLTLTLAASVWGWRHQKLFWVVLGGVFYGLSFYTYVAVRVTPLALGAFLAFWFLFQRRTFPPLKWLLAFAIPTLLICLPLAQYAYLHPDIYFNRSGQVTIFSAENFWLTLWQNMGRVVGMFFWHGDEQLRHNIPGRPVFDLLLAPVWGLGVGWLGWRLVRAHDLRAALILGWLVVMLGPTIGTLQAPHYLRASGALPLLFLPAALMFNALMETFYLQGIIITATVLMASATLTVTDYFEKYAALPALPMAFQAATVELAQRINQAPGEIWVDRPLWDFANVRYLFDPNTDVHLTIVAPLSTADTLSLFFWPFRPDTRELLSTLPPQRDISPLRGGLLQGEIDSTPFVLYDAYTIQPATARPVLAQFARGFELRAVQIWSDETAMQVQLMWSVTTTENIGAPHVFVQYFDGSTITAQDDAALTHEVYPPSWWRVGDQVADKHQLMGISPQPGARLFIGLYDYPDLKRLSVLQSTYVSSNDAIEIPLDP